MKVFRVLQLVIIVHTILKAHRKPIIPAQYSNLTCEQRLLQVVQLRPEIYGIKVISLHKPFLNFKFIKTAVLILGNCTSELVGSD